MSKVVFLVVYKHRHGEDYAVTTTQAGAYSIAASWVYEAVVQEDRFDGLQPELVEMCKRQNADPQDGPLDEQVIDFYLKIEHDTFNGESLEVSELPLHETADDAVVA
jgi:hypothetical protein